MICRKSSFEVEKQEGSPINPHEGPCPGRLPAPDICVDINYPIDRPRTLHDERAPNGAIYPSLPPPQGPTPPLSGAPARGEEGSSRLSPGLVGGA